MDAWNGAKLATTGLFCVVMVLRDYIFISLIFASVVTHAASDRTQPLAQTTILDDDCARLFIDHVIQFEDQEFGFKPLSAFDEQMNMRSEATVAFRLSPVSGTPKVAAEFARNHPGLTIPDRLMPKEGSSFFFVAQGSMGDLRNFKAQLSALFQQVPGEPKLTFQVLDSVVHRLEEVRLNLLPQGYWIDPRMDDFEATLTSPLSQIRQIHSKGFLIRDRRTEAAFYVLSADRFEPVFRSKDLMAIVGIDRYVLPIRQSLRDWVNEGDNLRELISRWPKAFRYRDVYIINHEAFRALGRLEGRQAKARARGSVMVSNVLRKALDKCISEYCPVDEEALAEEALAESPVDLPPDPLPPVVEPPPPAVAAPTPRPTTKPLSVGTLHLPPQPSLAPRPIVALREVVRPSQPRVRPPVSAPAVKPKPTAPPVQTAKAPTPPAIQSQDIFSAELIRKLETLSRWRANIELNPQTLARVSSESLGRFKIKVSQDYEQIVKPLLKSYQENLDLIVSSPELAELAQQEVADIRTQLKLVYTDILRQFKTAMPGVDDGPVLIEIGPESGQAYSESEVKMMINMYQALAKRKGWTVDLVDETVDRTFGLRHAVLRVEGREAFSHLQLERGTHKMRGRLTGAAQGAKEGSDYAHFLEVRVYSEKPVQGIQLSEKDIHFETMRSSGKGGQHVNKTDSAVRATHIPSGITVRVESQRSQHQNKATAIAMIAQELQKRVAQQAKKQKEQSREAVSVAANGSPYVRIYDYRTTNYEMDKIVKGGIQELLEEKLHQKTEAELLALPD